MTIEEAGFEYDLFISYATKNDGRLAGRLKSYLESFHKTRTGRQKGLKPLKVCVDGFDFVMSSGTTPENVPEMIERYLMQSRRILVLCAPESMQSRWVRDEIRFFIEHKGAASLMLALTHGAPNDPETFFASELVAEGLHETGWYDLRAFYRNERRLTGRAFDAERLRLLAFLHDGQSSSDIETLWAREQRRARTIRWTIGTTVAVVTLALAGGVYLQRRLAKEEALRAQVEASMRQVSQAYRHRFSDPFTAAADAYRSSRTAPAGQIEPEPAAAIKAVHQVLVERRRIALQERIIVKPGSFSFLSQASTGQRFTKLSQNGERVLVVTERRGNPFSPEAKGDAYVLNNRTLDLVKLDRCTETPDYRLEFADFVGADKVLVARAFHVDLYTVGGDCLGSYQLQHTKTPVTAAGGMLYDVFFIAGNGAGCIWVQEYGDKGLVKPAEELGAVSYCDDKKRADAVVRILTGPQKRFALNLFQSGRVDLFGLDGKNGGPKRRPVLDQGGVAVAFRPGENSLSFVVSFIDADSGAPGLARWDMDASAPKQVANFELAPNSPPVDTLGFSVDGAYLVGLDATCTLSIWDVETRSRVLQRKDDQSMCR